ncbi:hypothetical protein B0H13DRAFT_1875596 [Mycena leptocephala]|nr:hypothetical protein B0H13DRAFT_1875596 [Mycena leptocephala]
MKSIARISRDEEYYNRNILSLTLLREEIRRRGQPRGNPRVRRMTATREQYITTEIYWRESRVFNDKSESAVEAGQRLITRREEARGGGDRQICSLCADRDIDRSENGFEGNSRRRKITEEDRRTGANKIGRIPKSDSDQPNRKKNVLTRWTATNHDFDPGGQSSRAVQDKQCSDELISFLERWTSVLG